MRTIIRSGLLVVLLLVASLATAPDLHAASPLPAESVYHLPLVLTDQDGHAADWRAHRGKVQVVSMFYTSCAYICPLIVDSGKAIERALDAPMRERLGILLISMDPARDHPAALATVLRERKLDPLHWSLAAPQAKDVRAVAGILGIRYRELADGAFNHSSALVLLDAEGRILARTEQVGSVADPGFIDAVRGALAH
jgi:protein SCO1/2